MVQRSGDKGFIASGTTYDFSAGSTISHTLIIQCKPEPKRFVGETPPLLSPGVLCRPSRRLLLRWAASHHGVH